MIKLTKLNGLKGAFSSGKRILFMLSLLMLSMAELYAVSPELSQVEQNRTARVSGTITDSGGDHLPGATIQIKGSTRGVIADVDGNYEFPDCPVGSTLMVSFVGMETIEQVYNGEPRLDF
ncbi:MAG: hypothetical protein GX042_11975, partial [Bacteroidales bacterium]|nr:hypothetical protein [Bacteroidales bacterium]